MQNCIGHDTFMGPALGLAQGPALGPDPWARPWARAWVRPGPWPAWAWLGPGLGPKIGSKNTKLCNPDVSKAFRGILGPKLIAGGSGTLWKHKMRNQGFWGLGGRSPVPATESPSRADRHDGDDDGDA